ncbi:LAMI_0E02168g1_1 [Lachancea mirantina]|uniref:LAMI_0E02168g1_1 n=1 Tax=Lachancea mirantina TaxID=1230905 RepID=A0A1G4JJ44_9SACH|nr:LAMI_0E02168g1_1 [Lachancea mirantina]
MLQFKLPGSSKHAMERFLLRFPRFPRVSATLNHRNLTQRRLAHYGSTGNRDDAPGFMKIAILGIVGTVIFVQAVKSLDKNQPKNWYSEEEFENVVQGLRRRVSIFKQGDLDLTLIAPGVSQGVARPAAVTQVFDATEIVDFFRKEPDGRYVALLEELSTKEGETRYIRCLPKGMLVMLIGTFLKSNCCQGDSVVIMNCPFDVQDAIKFENEVSVVTKFVCNSSEKDAEIAKYYDTVGKTELV